MEDDTDEVEMEFRSMAEPVADLLSLYGKTELQYFGHGEAGSTVPIGDVGSTLVNSEKYPSVKFEIYLDPNAIVLTCSTSLGWQERSESADFGFMINLDLLIDAGKSYGSLRDDLVTQGYALERSAVYPRLADNPACFVINFAKDGDFGGKENAVKAVETLLQTIGEKLRDAAPTKPLD